MWSQRRPFACSWRLTPLFQKTLVVDVGFEVAETVPGRVPALADGLVEEGRQRRVGEHHPAARRDPVGLVAEALGKGLVKVVQRVGFEQFSVQLGDAVDRLAADDGKEGHAMTVFSSSSPMMLMRRRRCVVVRKALAHGGQEAGVDLVDDLEMARQQGPEEG